LGTNLGQKAHNLSCAIHEIGKRIGSVVSQSAFLPTSPWGFQSENEFLNCCIAVDTELSPLQLLRATQDIERQLGRTQKSDGTYHDRIIDIDILLYADLQLRTPALTLPHPHMGERLFVLQPLAEIAPNIVVPGTSKSVAEMLSTLAARS